MKSWFLCFVFLISMVVLINGVAARNINEDGNYVPVPANWP